MKKVCIIKILYFTLYSLLNLKIKIMNEKIKKMNAEQRKNIFVQFIEVANKKESFEFLNEITIGYCPTNSELVKIEKLHPELFENVV